LIELFVAASQDTTFLYRCYRGIVCLYVTCIYKLYNYVDAVVTVKSLNGSSWFSQWRHRQHCIRCDNGSPDSEDEGLSFLFSWGKVRCICLCLSKNVPISIVVLTYLDKSLNMRAWLKVNNDSLVDMGMWTH